MTEYKIKGHEINDLPGLIDTLPSGILVISEAVDLDVFSFTELRQIVKLFLQKLWGR
jgi:hypothetical protein